MIKFDNKELQKVYKKAIVKDGLFNVFIYRKISIRITKVLASFGFTPNQVTLLVLIFNIIASCLFLLGNYTINIYALIPLNFARLLDSCDGEIAILTNSKSELGGFLDPLIDRVSDLLIFTGLSIGYLFSTGSHLAVYLLALFSVVWFFDAYLDKYALKYKTNSSIDNLRQSTSFLSEDIRRYIRWDGGFSTLLISFFIVLNAVPMLLVIFILINLIPTAVTFKQILKAV